MFDVISACCKKDPREFIITPEKDAEYVVEIVAKLHPIVAGDVRKDDKFTFNKDAGMMVCPAGHMAFKKTNAKVAFSEKNKKKNDSYITSIFSSVANAGMLTYVDTRKDKTLRPTL